MQSTREISEPNGLVNYFGQLMLESLHIVDAETAVIRGDVNQHIEAILKDDQGELLRQTDIHRSLQEFIAKNSRGVIIFPREHGKTTQLIGLCSWLIGNNPNVRIKIISSTDDIAIARCKAVREILEKSTEFRSYYPHIKEGREWKDSRWSVVRDVITPESTLEAFGINSSDTGGRADYVFFDDPDDLKVVLSRAIRDRNIQQVQNVWLNLLAPQGRAYLLCTPWHSKDVAHTMTKERDWPELRYVIKDMVPVWEARWPTEALEQKKTDIGSLAFARGYEGRVLSKEDTVIRPEWFNYWTTLPPFTAIGIAVDPAISEKESADYTAICGLGITEDNRVHLLHVIRKRMDFPTTLATIVHLAGDMKIYHKLTPTIGIEDVAYQRALPQLLKRNSQFPIKGLKASSSKYVRALRLSVHAENGRVFLKGDENKPGIVHPDQKIVLEECVEFPSGAHDDCLDALGYGVEMLISGQSNRFNIQVI